MGKPGITKQPCHGCGTTAEHPQSSLCYSCAKLLEAGKKAEEQQRTSTAYLEVTVHPLAHLTPRARLFGHTPHDPRIQEADTQFAQAWLVFLLAATEPSVGYATRSPHRIVTPKDHFDYPDMGIDNKYDDGPVRLVRKELWEAINMLDEIFRRMVALAYYHGVSYGSDILLRLYDGTMAQGEFGQQQERASRYLNQLLTSYKANGSR